MPSWSERVVTLPPGRRTLPEDFVKQHQRSRIFGATAELVAERGYHRTSIDLITRTARVGLSTFYENFETKQDCFIAAFDDAVAEVTEALSTAVDRSQPWPEQIAAGLDVVLQLLIDNPAKARMCLVEAQGGGPELLSHYEQALDAVVPILREGRELADERLPDRLEETIVGGLVWVLYREVMKGELVGLKRLRPQLLQVAVGSYIGEAEARKLVAAAEDS